MLHEHLSINEIETAVNDLGPSPRDIGTVELISIRPASNERHVVDQVEISLVDGVVGDNWRARGSKGTPDGSANPEAQITLMNSRVIQALAGVQDGWAIAGDQLFVDFDLSDDNLPAGQRIAIGTAVLEISALPHTGCAKFTERFGSGAIHYVNSPEGRANRRRGVNARVIQPGVVRRGDTVQKIDAE
jgi:MOSC domain-containing protein YiiM